jgi:2-oxopent-4-enoate/cis-2-oxohex-4-enoate hydratase
VGDLGRTHRRTGRASQWQHSTARWRAAAGDLDAHVVKRRTVPPLRDRVDGLTLADAYRIASRFVERRVNAGETVVGKKIGLTSEAVQTQFGVYEPDFGQLLSGMAHHDGAVIDLDALIQPKAEGEVAFVLKSDLNGPGVTAADVLAATDYVQACFEIVDSRIEGWNIRIGDTVADNASCGLYILGEMHVDPDDLDLAAVEMVVERNGEVATSGTGAAVQGSPVNSVVWLANTLGHLFPLPSRRGDSFGLTGELRRHRGGRPPHLPDQRPRGVHRLLQVGVTAPRLAAWTMSADFGRARFQLGITSLPISS